MKKNNCRSCVYMDRAVSPQEGIPDTVYCHRYPRCVPVEDYHWCGEWNSAEMLRKWRKSLQKED